MNKKFSIVVCLAAAALIIPAVPAAAADKPVDTDILAEHMMAPLSLALSPGKSVLVTQNFAGRLDRVEDDGKVTNVYTRTDWDVGGVETRGNTTFFVESVGAGPDTRDLEGYLKSINGRGEVKTVANLALLETRDNPDAGQHYGFGDDVAAECLAKFPAEAGIPPRYTGIVDSHPYATAVRGNTVYVADAGMNAILSVNSATGETSVLAVLPPRPAKVPEKAALPVKDGGLGLPECVVGREFAFEFVPTDVEFGPDGWLYVSSLPGGPEDDSWGARGSIFRVNPSTGATHLWADGILSPTGIAVSHAGDVYAASMFGNEIVKIDARTREQSRFMAVDGPAAVELRDQDLFATAGFSFANPAAGTVLEAETR